jgi:hypothetical protein
MNPPQPPDEQPPPLPTGPGPESSPTGGAGRDPLFDDPHFAELLARDTPRPAEPAREEPEADFAQEVDGPVESEPVVAEVVSRPAGGTSDLPRAEPIRPAAPREAGPPGRAERVRPAPSPGPTAFAARKPDSGPPPPTPRPRIYAACCVIGCLGVAVLAAVGFLAFVAIVVLERLGDQIEDQDMAGDNSVSTSRPGPIAPPRSIPKNVMLSGRVDSVGRAGGGRFLLLRIPQTRQLAVFDPNEADASYLDLSESNALFAGGASKIYVYEPGARTLERWDLLTRKREHKQKQPPDLPMVTAMAVGAASDGLVYLFSTGERGSTVTVVDPVELKPRRSHKLPDLRSSDTVLVRASDDGSILAVSEKSGASVFKYEGAEIHPLDLWKSGPRPQLATPSPDGKYVYTPRGWFPTSQEDLPVKMASYFYTLPTAHGSGLYLSLDVDRNDKIIGSPRLHAAGSARTLATLDQLTFGAGQGAMYASEWGEPPHDQRVHLWPAAGLMAFIPVLNPSVIELVKVDVGEELRKSGEEHLVIGSDPPTAARGGEQWTYRPQIWSLRSQAVEIRLRDRPSGMQIRGGVITWTPAATGAFEVTVEARDPVTDRTAEQRFRIVVAEPSGDTE